MKNSLYKHSKMGKCLNEQHTIVRPIIKINMDMEGWYHELTNRIHGKVVYQHSMFVTLNGCLAGPSLALSVSQN